MIFFTSGGGLGTLVEESMGEEGHIMLLLTRDLGCDLRVGRTFRTPQRGFWRQGLTLRQGATIHMMLPGHAATCWAIGHKIHAAAGENSSHCYILGRFLVLRNQSRSMYMRQNYPPGNTPGKEFNTENLVAHPAPKPSITKSFQKIPSAGIGARKISSY